MILDRSIIKEIERHFFNWQQERLELEDAAKAVAERSDYGFDASGVRGSEVSDPVLRGVIELDERTRVLKAWTGVVEAVRNKFKGTQYLQLMTMVYAEKASPVKVQNEMFIGESTYYEWKKDILIYAALKACEAGVLRV